jgi:hypothetical protein
MAASPSVMISYRTPDRHIADEISRELDAAGLSPWMDYKGIRPGSKWRDELLKQVRNCDVFIALLTPEYLRSEHCRMELLIARSRGCVVLPVMLQDAFAQLDAYEESKGLADTFTIRLFRLSVVGLPITREEAIERLVASAKTAGQEAAPKSVYVSYCNEVAVLATRIADQLERDGISAWVATRDCKVGDNWRQAQARGLMNASAQLVVLDESIVEAKVLRTEIMLGEAFGLPVYTVLSESLSQDPDGVTDVMKKLRAADLTFRRLTDMQPFAGDGPSLTALSKFLRSTRP